MPKPKVMPPIKDSNHDKILEGHELLAQLNEEQKARLEGKPGKDKIYGILTALELEEPARKYFQLLENAYLHPPGTTEASDLEKERVRIILEIPAKREDLRSKILDEPNFEERIAKDPRNIGLIQQYGAHMLKQALSQEAMLKFGKENKPAVDYYKDRILRSAIEPKDKGYALSDVKNAQAFVDTFKKTFPKGIKIAAEEATDILRHIAPELAVRRYDKTKEATVR